MSRIGLWGVIGVLNLVVVGGLISFLWLPSAQLGASASLWRTFCTSIGVPRAMASEGARTASAQSSQVILTHTLLPSPNPEDIGHGATLALRCTICHGPTGISYANSPNLSGQFALAIYKELRDYQTGARSNAIMSPMAQSLTDTDLRVLAAYYSSLPKSREAREADNPPDIVRWGSPMRNVAPCGSCHGTIEHSSASPWLNGEPAGYLSEQLKAFASGARTNDINGQMRAMVQGMSPSDIAAAAAYYSGQTGT